MSGLGGLSGLGGGGGGLAGGLSSGLSSGLGNGFGSELKGEKRAEAMNRLGSVLKKDPLDPLTSEEKGLLWGLRVDISNVPEVFFFF